MCKILWNKELLFIFSRKFYTVPLSESRRILSQIDRNIKDLSVYHTDKLILWEVDLEMQATEYTLFGSRLIVLYKNLINARLFEVVIIIRLHKISSGVTEYSRCNDFQSFNMTGFYCYFSHFPILFFSYLDTYF